MDEITTRYELDGSYAAPLLLNGEEAHPMLQERQAHFANMFEALAHEELDGRIGEEGANFVAEKIRHRMSQREGQNSSSYVSRRRKHFPKLFIPGHSPLDVFQAVRNAEYGKSSPLQAHLARISLAMATIESGQLTTVGTARKQFLHQLHDGVEELAGHEVDFGIKSIYRTTYLGTDANINNGKKPKLLRVEYKSKFATLEDDSILKGRSTAILDVSNPTEFDPELIHHFQEIYEKKRTLADVPEFAQVVHNVVTGVIDPRFVVAENKTIYEVNYEEITKQAEYILRRTKRRELQRRLFSFATTRPTIDKSHAVGDPRHTARTLHPEAAHTHPSILLERLKAEMAKHARKSGDTKRNTTPDQEN